MFIRDNLIACRNPNSRHWDLARACRMSTSYRARSERQPPAHPRKASTSNIPLQHIPINQVEVRLRAGTRKRRCQRTTISHRGQRWLQATDLCCARWYNASPQRSDNSSRRHSSVAICHRRIDYCCPNRLIAIMVLCNAHS